MEVNLQSANRTAQYTTPDISAMVKTETGIQQVFAVFIETTLFNGPDPAFPVPARGNTCKRLTVQQVINNSGTTTDVFEYRARDWSIWSAYIGPRMVYPYLEGRRPITDGLRDPLQGSGRKQLDSPNGWRRVHDVRHGRKAKLPLSRSALYSRGDTSGRPRELATVFFIHGSNPQRIPGFASREQNRLHRVGWQRVERHDGYR
jgi:hypothetical protein